jgi:DNA-binding NarL/FixJ family response regulator
MINITIAIGYEHDRAAMIALLASQDDFRIASIGKDGYDALLSAKKYQPDIIIMDFCLADIDSPDLAPVIKRHSPLTGIIVLCSCAQCRSLNKAIRAGISGYLVKQNGFGNLASSVRSVYYGGFYISRLDEAEALNWFDVYVKNTGMKKEVFSIFTPTELGILSGIILGYTDTEIASSLNINIGTLRNCVSKVKKKTGFRNRMQIILYALRTGIIQLQNNVS